MISFLRVFAGWAMAAACALAAAADQDTATSLTGNVGLFSQYIFRGQAQTNRHAALQGALDYAHRSGWYAGTWASNASWLRDAAPAAYESGGRVEWDFYGGYKWSPDADIALDVGTLYYWFPGRSNAQAGGFDVGAPKADTWEAYGAASWKRFSVKWSYNLLDHVFTVRDARGSWYLDLAANCPLSDRLVLNVHWGYFRFLGSDPRNAGLPRGVAVPGNDEIYSYKDVKLGFTYGLGNALSAGAFYTKGYGYDTRGYGTPADAPAGTYPRGLLKSAVTVFVQHTF